MKAIMMTVRLWWFYLTYKGIKKAEIRKRFAKDFKGKIFECVSKTNWKKDLMKIPEEEREFFKQFVGKVGLCFECNKVEKIITIGMYYHETKTLDKNELPKLSCLTRQELDNYLQGENGYAIHITNLEIFDKPKEISEFSSKIEKTCICFNQFVAEGTRKIPLTRAPESWCYVEI